MVFGRAFLATRYVDKWQDEGNDNHRVVSNRLQALGVSTILLSLGGFITGSLILAICLHTTLN